MSFKGSSKWKAEVFEPERQGRKCAVVNAGLMPYIERENGDWILFGPQDVRDRKPKYHFALQRLICDKVLRVRVGCRYYTLEQAWNHWHKVYNCYIDRRLECKQAIAIIQLMILQAQAYNLLDRYRRVKFDNSLTRKKRK